ncbi:MAG: GGDEF domain-containing protein [Oscillospiraceae bacterium]
MKSQNKKIIAFCTTMVHQETQKELLSAIYERAKQLGYHIIVINTFVDMYYSEKDMYNYISAVGESEIFKLINYDIVDGIIVASETFKKLDVLENLINTAKQHNVPIISIDKHIDGVYNIKYSYERAMEQIIRHIIEHHGCRRINFIAGIKGNSFSEERLNVYKNLLKEYDIPIEEERIGYGEFWFMPTEKVMDDFFNSSLPFPEAIICSNDSMAITCCKKLNEKGYRVPEDVLVTGFDGITQEKYHIPRLTTAKQNNHRVGVVAVDILNEIFNGENPEKEYTVYHEFIVAGSCGCNKTISTYSNVALSELYNQLDNYKFYESDMQSMLSSMTTRDNIYDIIEILNIKGYAQNLYTDEMWVCLCEEFLNLDDNTPKQLEKPYKNMKVFYHLKYNGYVPMEDYFNASEMLPNLDEYLNDEKNRFLIFSPIHFQESTIGYIVISTTSVDFNFDAHLSFSNNLSKILSIIQTRAKLKRAVSKLEDMNCKLEEMYVRDYLTGLLNRRGFYKNLRDKLETIRNDENKSFMIISIDLNGLKYINDVFGHSDGDNAIKTVAKYMQSSAINDEVCARFGGDEFIVASVVDTDSNYPQEYVSRLKKSIDEYNKISGKPYQVGASCGIFLGRPQSEVEVDEMIKKADDIMYDEKRNTKYQRGR